MKVQVKEDGESECQVVMTWIGVESPITSPRTKVSRLPSGLSMQETDAKLLGKEEA
jgi:hypothetical protein